MGTRETLGLVDKIVILALKNLLFTLVVPGSVGVYLPLILARTRTSASGLGFALAILLFGVAAVSVRQITLAYCTQCRPLP